MCLGLFVGTPPTGVWWGEAASSTRGWAAASVPPPCLRHRLLLWPAHGVSSSPVTYPSAGAAAWRGVPRQRSEVMAAHCEVLGTANAINCGRPETGPGGGLLS